MVDNMQDMASYHGLGNIPLGGGWNHRKVLKKVLP